MEIGRIEQFLVLEDWASARRQIERELAGAPGDHWLLSRLALTYYEQQAFGRALELLEGALALAPGCPLVRWDLAGVFQALGRFEEAISLYRGLIEQDRQGLAFGPCGEGLAWTRGLQADCCLRLSDCLWALQDQAGAVAWMQAHLSRRGPGCRSMYPIAEARRRLAEREKPTGR